MNEWEIVAAVLGTCVVACGGVALLGAIGDALIALEIAGTLATAILMALSEGLQRQPFIDLALTIGVLSLLGSLVFARMLEDEP